jgi:hypothetical protein
MVGSLFQPQYAQPLPKAVHGPNRIAHHHFDPSDVTITYTLPTTPVLKREKLHTLFPRPRKTLYHFDLTQTLFPCILRPRPLYIDLDTLCSTLSYYIIFIILHFSLCFISFILILLDLLLLTLDCVYEPPHSLKYHYPITIELDITLTLPFSHRTFAIGTD